MTRRAERRLLWSVVGLIAVVVVGAGVAAVADGSPITFVTLARVALFTVVGMVIARHRRRHAVAWVLLVSALLSAVNQGAYPSARLGLAHGWDPSLVHALAVAFTLPWVGSLFLPFTVGLLRFPESRLPGRLWLVTERVAIGATVTFTLLLGVLAAGSPTSELLKDGTATFTGWQQQVFLVCEAAIVVLVVCLVLTLASVVVRWRRSGPVEREQIRWVLSAGIVAIALQVAVVVVDVPGWVQDVGTGLGYAALAVAVGFAITRYKLYEIDRIVSRTVSYVAVLALLAVVYAAIVTGAASFVPDDYGQIGVAAATLVVVAMFVPVRRIVQRSVDRRFNRARFDAERVVTAFASRLRERPDADDLSDDLLAVVDRTVQPAHAGLWLVAR